MNPDERNLADDERRLLGERAAGQLLDGERWLAGKLGPPDAPVPDRVRFRAREAVGLELDRQRRRARPMPIRLPYGWGIAAAILVGGLLAVLSSIPPGPAVPRRSMTPAEVRRAQSIARAQSEVDAYVQSVDPGEIQLHNQLDQLTRELSAPEANPWDLVVEALNGPMG